MDLVDEAAYADAFYRRNQADLALNPTFFRKYAAPTREWDWRQWGMKRLGTVTGCKVLDFGCGAGEEAVYLAKLGARVTAIDISPVGIELTRERAAANGVAVDARVCAATQPTFLTLHSTSCMDSASCITSDSTPALQRRIVF